jgi:polyphosphate kinase
VYLADNVQAWELRADGHYERFALPPNAEPITAQITLLRQLAEAS